MVALRVDVWSDILCPWCYIGKRNFETALGEFPDRDRVEIRWHSFELDPGMDREPQQTLLERHHRDLGGTIDDARARLAMVSDLAAQAGLAYDLPNAVPVNSFDAHRLTKLGDATVHGDAVRERVMRAYTGERAVLTDPETLVRLGADAGIDAEAVRNMLSGTDFADAVRDDERLAARFGVSGVPTFVFGERYGISGGRPPGDFRRALEQLGSSDPTGATPSSSRP
ncbi:DsbA family oxidoreductase [Nocardia mexicana]|uniref:Putative DsbA family dithiol-disulfide isomerase n=1 Tax=Nocardia mexicana TaxID=279262 RepID=A0A370HBW5_9NOCA|nr:DsbA family oxidoreductase [Nocardia mexicana]RDI54408.1 putative DsbA family dithiol-disulfide isomerase [Nocardia mexicana]